MKTALVALCAAAFLVGSAKAEPVLITAEFIPSERVSFADLNLDSTAGRETLKRRIRGAAKRVCETEAERSFESYLMVRGCSVSAYTDGLRNMDTLIARRAGGSTVAAAFLTIHGE